MVTHANLTEACSKLGWFAKCTPSSWRQSSIWFPHANSREPGLELALREDGETFPGGSLGARSLARRGRAHRPYRDTGTATLKDGRESWDAGKGEGRRECNYLRKSAAGCGPR